MSTNTSYKVPAKWHNSESKSNRSINDKNQCLKWYKGTFSNAWAIFLALGLALVTLSSPLSAYAAPVQKTSPSVSAETTPPPPRIKMQIVKKI